MLWGHGHFNIAYVLPVITLARPYDAKIQKKSVCKLQLLLLN